MSNIFQYLVRDTGGLLPLAIGSGPLVDPVKSQGLNLDATGAIYAVLDGTPVTYSNGLAFDVDGRLVVSAGIITHYIGAIPFTATGAVAGGVGDISHYSQGLAYFSGGGLSVTGDVPPVPVITLNPVDQTVVVGDYWEMETAATDYVSVQWWFSDDGGSSYEKANGFDGDSELTPTIYQSSANENFDGYLWKAIYTNANGDAETTAALLTVLPLPPVITLNPVDQTVVEGDTATFTSDATDYDTVQWWVNTGEGAPFTIFSGQTNPTLNWAGVQLADDGRQVKAIYTNAGGDSETTAAVLTVTPLPPPPPVITTDPTSQTVVEGTNVTFTSAGTGQDSIQWYKNGAAISGATSASYTYNSVLIGDSGATYFARYTNTGGSTDTATATLTVTSAVPSFDFNIGDNGNLKGFASGAYGSITPTAVGGHEIFALNISSAWVHAGNFQTATDTGNSGDITITAGGVDYLFTNTSPGFTWQTTDEGFRTWVTNNAGTTQTIQIDVPF